MQMDIVNHVLFILINDLLQMYSYKTSRVLYHRLKCCTFMYAPLRMLCPNVGGLVPAAARA